MKKAILFAVLAIATASTAEAQNQSRKASSTTDGRQTTSEVQVKSVDAPAAPTAVKPVADRAAVTVAPSSSSKTAEAQPVKTSEPKVRRRSNNAAH